MKDGPFKGDLLFTATRDYSHPHSLLYRLPIDSTSATGFGLPQIMNVNTPNERYWWDVSSDPQGNIYIADINTGEVVEITPNSGPGNLQKVG